MTQLIDTICQYIEDNTPTGYEWTTEGNIRDDDMPDTPDELIAVYNRGGVNLNNEGTEIKVDQIQVITRSLYPVTARDLLYDIHTLFVDAPSPAPTGTPNVNFDTPTVDSVFYHVHTLVPIGSPTTLGKDESGRYRYSANYRITYILGG